MDHPFLCTSGPLEFDRIRLCLVCHRSVVAYFTIHTISSVDDYHPVSACDRESEPVWHVLASSPMARGVSSLANGKGACLEITSDSQAQN